jgi:hypothetical protein
MRLIGKKKLNQYVIKIKFKGCVTLQKQYRKKKRGSILKRVKKTIKFFYWFIIKKLNL